MNNDKTDLYYNLMLNKHWSSEADGAQAVKIHGKDYYATAYRLDWH
jgi:hypothetical protein